jgi:hypothetical protein
MSNDPIVLLVLAALTWAGYFLARRQTRRP